MRLKASQEKVERPVMMQRTTTRTAPPGAPKSAMRAALAPLVAGLVGAGCLGGADPAPPAAGARLAIDVAALNLVGVGDVVWDLEVLNGAGAVVWQRRVTSSAYGDSAGSASYVGACDADPLANANTVRVWVVGVYDADVPAGGAGAFSSGAATGAGSVSGDPVPFQNPTTAGAPLSRTVTCLPDADAAVAFDVVLMRPAQQGFFDIAVSFNDLFCSAKFDCCADAADDGCAADGSEDLRLLFDASGARGRTFVLGFACTAGAADGVATDLYMDDLTLDCAGVAPAVTIHPNGASAGNQCVAGANGMTACPAVSEHAPIDADTYLFQVATFRGEELLTSGGVAARKRYWNVALGVKAAISGCTLRARATADDANSAGDGLVGGVIVPGAIYPVVSWDVDLAACASEPLTFGVAGASVATAYAQTTSAAPALDYRLRPGAAPEPVCATACGNGGSCTAPGVCACAAGYWGASCAASCAQGHCTGAVTCDGATGATLSCTGCAAGYTGATCATPVCSPTCQNGGSCTAPNTCACLGTGYTGATCQTAVCSPACQNGGVCSAPNTCNCNGTGYTGATCQTPTVPASTNTIATAELYHTYQNPVTPTPYLPFSVAGTVTLRNTADGYVFALGRYYNLGGALYQAGIAVAGGKLYVITTYSVPSALPFTAANLVGTFTPNQSFHLAVEAFAADTQYTTVRVALNGTWVRTVTLAAYPPGYNLINGYQLFGTAFGTGTPNQIFWGLDGTVTNLRHWSNQLLWNGASFNPAAY